MFAYLWRYFQECAVCECRRCPVWATHGRRPAGTVGAFLQHRGFTS